MALSQERKLEIAWKYLKKIIAKRGLHSLQFNDVKRELANDAKKFGVPEEDIVEFAHELMIEMFEEAFPSPKSAGNKSIIV